MREEVNEKHSKKSRVAPYLSFVLLPLPAFFSGALQHVKRSKVKASLFVK